MRQKILPLLFSLVAALGMFCGYKLQKSAPDELVSSHDSDQLSLISEVHNLVRANYFGDLDTGQYIESVVSQLTSNLDDYSGYIKPVDVGGFKHAIEGNYLGLGFDFINMNDSIVVIDIITNSPAEKAGLKRGDIILELKNPVDIYNGNKEMLNQIMLVDSTSLMIYRSSSENEFQVNIKKGQINTSPIESKILENGSIVYVKINRFSDDVFLAFMDELEHYKSNGLEFGKLIIDLRNNPGGLLDETVKILNQLIPESNRTILSTVNSNGKKKEYKSNGRSFLNIMDIAVLINGSSASASEILAGSLQDLELATVIGSNSFGKGRIQQHFSLSNGGTINLTIGEYLLPSGRRIKSATQDSVVHGITPDIVVDQDCDSDQNRFYEQYTYLVEQGLIHKKVLSTQELQDVTTSYEKFVDSHSPNEKDCLLQNMSILLWHEFQSELNLNSELIQKDAALSRAIQHFDK